MATVKKNIMLSSFSEKEKKDMTKKIKQLNGNCLSTPFYQSDCDVIVCRKLNRGEKFLCGCAAGKPLVIEDYVNKSVKAMKWLDPDPFQWSKQPKSVTKGYDQTLIQLPMKCLTHYKDGKGGIFSHWNVLLHVNSLNKLQAYRRLLIAGGAKIMRCKPPFPLSLKNQLTHVFCSREELGDLIALHRDGFHEIWHPEYIAEYLVLHPDNGPTVERFKHNFKTKGQGTPKKGTPKKSGTPKRPTPKRSKRPILTEEQMKNQRRITDMFSQKRKLETIDESQTSASGRTSPKRPCLNSLDNSVMARTPQKFQPTLYTIVHSKIKQEAQSPAPPLNASISSAANKSTDVISLLSDDDDGEESIKPPSTVKRNINEIEKWRLEKLLSQVADEPIPDGDVLGSIEVLGDFIPVNANQAIKDASKDLKSIKNENKLPTTTTATSDNELPQALTKSANKKKTTLSCSKVLFNNGTDDTPLTRRCIGMSHNFNSTPYFDNKNNKPLIIDLDTPVTERCMKSEFSDLMNESKPIIPVISLSDTPERLSPKSIIEIAGTPPVSEPTNQKTSQIPRKTELTNGNAATPSRGKNEPISVFDDDCIEMKNVHPPSGDTRASSTSTKITISLSDSDLDNIIKPEVAQIVDRLVASTEANTQSLVRSTFTSVKNTKTLTEQAESLSEAPLQNVRTSSRQRTIRKYPSDEYIVPKKREVFQQAKGSVSSDVNTNNNNEVFLESQPSLEQDEKPKTKKPKKRTKVPVLKIPKIPQENSRTSSRERKVRKYPSDEYVVPKRRGTAPGVSNKMSKSKSDSAVLRPKNHQLEPLSSNRKMSSSQPLPSHNDAEFTVNDDTYPESLTLSALKRIPDTEFKRTTRRNTTPTIKQEVLTPDKSNTAIDSAPVSGNNVPTLETTKQFVLDLCIKGKTLNWNPILPLSTNLKKMTSKKASGKDKKRAVFLLKWDNEIESSLDEKDFYPALCVLKENMSEFYYPNAKVISRFMNLLKDQTESFKRMELFCTLQCVPMLHPVKDLTSMYVHMLKNPKQEKREVKETTAMHDTLLEAARDARLILEDEETNSRLLSSCMKQAEYITNLLQNDFNDVIKEISSQVDIKDTNHHLLKKLRLSLIYQTLWGQHHELALNSTVKEFVEMTVSLYQMKDNSTEASTETFF